MTTEKDDDESPEMREKRTALEGELVGVIRRARASGLDEPSITSALISLGSGIIKRVGGNGALAPAFAQILMGEPGERLRELIDVALSDASA